MKVVVRARTEGKEILFEVGKMHVTLGRGDNAHIKVDDEDCSRTHCKFYVENNKFMVEDMASKNGTYVNGVRVSQSQLYVTDRVKVGDTEVYIPSDKNSAAVVQLLTFSGSTEERQRRNLNVEDTAALTEVRLNPMTAIKTPQIPQYRQSKKRLHADPMFKDAQLESKQFQSTLPAPGWMLSVTSFIDFAGIVLFMALPSFLYSFNKVAASARGVEGLSHIKKMAVLAGISLLLGFLFWTVNTKNSGGSIGERLLDAWWYKKQKKN